MNLKKAYKDFFNPRLSTEEFEKAFTRSKVPNEITAMIYDDKHPKFTVRVLGEVQNSHTTFRSTYLSVVWNQYGECFRNGVRLKTFDLIHPDRQEIDSSKIVLAASIGWLITLLITSLWN